MRLVEVDRTVIIEGNKQLRQPTTSHPKREQFFRHLYIKNDFRKAIIAELLYFKFVLRCADMHLGSWVLGVNLLWLESLMGASATGVWTHKKLP